ncbi:MAG TPA: autotransporter outer membrane beta-barrel domain-containing protein, partial [Bacteroidales bacterium]|nr:autotransporter outer membrane beta-barrel domain-containing protein [Bacteroidales bacterium]
MAAVSFFSVMAQPQSDVNLRKNQIDTATQMIWTGANFSYQFPFGTLAETFKNNWNIGTGFTYKTSSNWTIGLNFNYLFGSKIKDQVAILGTDMLTQNGDLIDGNGLKAT